MTEPYDVGVLIHFAEAISEQLEVELIELAHKWDALAEIGWPFGVAILPVGEYLMFVFEDPDNANLFIAHAEKHLQTVSIETTAISSTRSSCAGPVRWVASGDDSRSPRVQRGHWRS